MLEADQIEAIIPHRYPFLLVDRIIELEPGKSAVGIKNVTANEWFFQGHFPGKKIMPGVLVVEAGVGGDGGVRGDDDFVTGADAERGQGDVQRGGAAGDGDGVLDAEPVGQRFLVFQGGFGAAQLLLLGHFKESLELFLFKHVGFDNGRPGAHGGGFRGGDPGWKRRGWW